MPAESQRRRARRIWAVLIVGLALQAALLPLLSAEAVPWQAQTAGLLAGAVALVPLARWWARGDRTAPMFELICVAYLVQFYQPLFHQANGVWVVQGHVWLAWSTTTRALLLVALGVACLILGHEIAKRSFKGLPAVDLPIRRRRRSWFVAFALLVGVGGVALSATVGGGAGLAALVRLAEVQLYVLIALLVFWGFSLPGGQLWAKVLAVVVTALFAVVGLATGMLEQAVLPLIVFVIALWQTRRRLPWRLALAGVVVVVLLNSVKGEYREMAWVGRRNLGFFDKVATWVSLAGRGATGVAEHRQEPLREWLSASLARFDLLHRFSFVIRMTPDPLPYYHGLTYEYLAVAPVPRLLWPDKPTASQSNRVVDTDYGFLNDLESSTVIGIGMLPEAYANFGAAGVVVILFLQGALFGLLDRLLNGPRSEGGRAIYIWTMVFFLNGIGSSAAILFGALLQNVLVNAALLRPFAAGFRGSAPAPRIVVEVGGG